MCVMKLLHITSNSTLSVFSTYVVHTYMMVCEFWV